MFLIFSKYLGVSLANSHKTLEYLSLEMPCGGPPRPEKQVIPIHPLNLLNRVECPLLNLRTLDVSISFRHLFKRYLFSLEYVYFVQTEKTKTNKKQKNRSRQRSTYFGHSNFES